MLLDPTNWQDGDKYFTGCFIKVKEYGDTICRVEKVSAEGIWCTDEFGNNVCIELDGSVTNKVGYDLDYILPKRTWFQMGECAVFLNRNPARQWKKGICKQNTMLFSMMGSGKLAPEGLNFTTLHAYTHKPANHNKLPENGNINGESLAIHPRFAVSREGSLFLDLTEIGKVLWKDKTVLVKKLFVSDVTPLVSPYTVKGI